MKNNEKSFEELLKVANHLALAVDNLLDSRVTSMSLKIQEVQLALYEYHDLVFGIQDRPKKRKEK